MAGHGSETEVKIRLQHPEKIAGRLAEIGFVSSKPRVFEANTVFDRNDSELRVSGRLLRLREVGGTAVVTFKGPAQRGKHKSREELETTVASASTFRAILERLGFAATFRYEKYRAEYERPGGSGVVTVDETPVGWFMELEGEPDWIDETAKQLGYPESDYLTESYGSLYLQYCSEHHIEPRNMVFNETS